MATAWWPAYGHPDGPSSEEWFRFEGEWGYRAAGHPDGTSRVPCLRVVHGLVYATFDLPSASVPCFEIVGSFVYPAGRLGPPWFEIVISAGPHR